MVEKTAAFRQRRAADTRRWRERLDRGAPVYPVEVDGQLFDLMERFGGLKDSKTGDRQAIATAPWQVAAPRAGGVAAGRNCFPALGGVTQTRALAECPLLRRTGQAEMAGMT